MPSLIVRPQVALVDDDVSIRVDGLRPDQPAVLRVNALDHADRTWTGEVPITADGEGRAEVDDIAALVGSMRPADGGGPFVVRGTSTLLFSVEVLTDGAAFGPATELHRVMRDVGVSLTPIRQDGLVGSLYLPPGPGPHPGLVVLGGLEGGIPDAPAALLASRGFAALAVGLFGADGLPASLESVPVDAVGAALELLSGHLGVVPPPHAVVGWSAGGTVALLAAATWPELVDRVVAVSAPPVVFSAPAGAGAGGVATGAPWTYRGFTVPFVRTGDGEEARARATIPVERGRAEVMLVSGGADRVWPVAELGLQLERRLVAAGVPVTHRRHPDAGHGIRFPHIPTHAVGGALALGGSPAADARASAAVWPELVAFLGAGRR